MRIQAEFTVYPFIEGNVLPDYVQASIDAITGAGLDVDVGALSNTVIGPAGEVLDALARGVGAALDRGATRVVVNIEATS